MKKYLTRILCTILSLAMATGCFASDDSTASGSQPAPSTEADGSCTITFCEQPLFIRTGPRSSLILQL